MLRWASGMGSTNSLLQCTVVAALAAIISSPGALAQSDLVGGWSQKMHEDAVERGAGPDIGDYTGLPINARAHAGRCVGRR
jgi:hypothetical protein